VLEQGGGKRPDISVFSDEFSRRACRDRATKSSARNARAAAARRYKGTFQAERRSSSKVSDMLSEAISKYQNQSLTTTQLIEHLIAFAKELRDKPKRRGNGSFEDELAFFDVLAQSRSAIEVLGDAQLRAIARDPVKGGRESATIDWNLREGVRAGIR
jgi:type I restriction enzyme R subunit